MRRDLRLSDPLPAFSPDAGGSTAAVPDESVFSGGFPNPIMRQFCAFSGQVQRLYLSLPKDCICNGCTAAKLQSQSKLFLDSLEEKQLNATVQCSRRTEI
jgi:hypothetical protein